MMYCSEYIYDFLRENVSEEDIVKLADQLTWANWLFISKNVKLSEKFIRRFKDNINWLNVIKYQTLSESFIEEFADKIGWQEISRYADLSEEFIKKHLDRLVMVFLVRYTCFSDDLLEYMVHVDPINSSFIEQYQTLSEDFMEKYFDILNGYELAYNQPLSESFIERHLNDLNLSAVSIKQKLSEDFIERHIDKLDWKNIGKFQVLSEEFIEKYIDKLGWETVLKYQHLSQEFIDRLSKIYKEQIGWELPLEFYRNYQYLDSEKSKEYYLLWLYKDKEFKRQAILNCGLYEIEGDYVIAYKTTRRDGYSVYNFQYRYEVGKTYEAHADYNLNNTNSFGLSAWTKKNALSYYSFGKLFKVAIHLDDLAVLNLDHKLRTKKMTVLEEIPIKRKDVLHLR